MVVVERGEREEREAQGDGMIVRCTVVHAEVSCPRRLLSLALCLTAGRHRAQKQLYAPLDRGP